MKNLLPTFFLILLIILSCNPTEPVDNRQLTINIEDVSCIEVWLSIKTANITLPSSINITANSIFKEQITMFTNDTLIILDSLQPNTNYSFQANTREVSSVKVSAVTMDTTSHDFSWQTFEFGEHSSSNLRDVAIINENNIWVVGEIYMKDSLGQPDPHAYNALHWDGLSWELKKILFYTICGQTSLSSYPAKAIHAFNENDIWIAGGGRQLARISGTVQMNKICLPFSMSINKLWGTSSNNLYATGNNGNLVNYNGSPSADGWQKIESGTELDIYDIWGDYNEQAGEYEILAVAAKLLHSADRDILKIANNGVEKIDETGIDWSLRGIWFKSGRKYYTVGSGIYFKHSLESNESWDESLGSLTNYYTHSIRGSDLNDIFICGAYNEVLHFNGRTWKSLRGIINPSETGRLTKVAFDGKTSCIVGSNDGKAILYLGTR